MSSQVSIRHNFETAHRLPTLGGKCTNLHGHSWWVQATFTGLKADNGVVAEFATLKRGLRTWVDDHLDHAVMLGFQDPLIGPLTAEGCKVFTFGQAPGSGCEGERYGAGLWWPTVENVAELLARVARDIAAPTPGLFVARVQVTETHVNAAEWTP